MTLAERKALEAAVLAAADSEARQGYEQAPARLRATLLLGLVREHVTRELSSSSFERKPCFRAGGSEAGSVGERMTSASSGPDERDPETL
jgi:hypothetical protein